MAQSLIDLAARVAGWRGRYLKYAFAVTSTSILPAEYRPHLDRVIARRSGGVLARGRSPDDPHRAATSQAIAAYSSMTARRRDRLGDYWLGLAVHDLLQIPDAVVRARNSAGTVESLRAADLREASIDIRSNSMTVGAALYTQVEVDFLRNLSDPACPSLTGSADDISCAIKVERPAPVRRGRSSANLIDDSELLKKVRDRPASVTSRAAIIQNIGSDMTAGEQDTIVHRIQRKLRESKQKS
jgi:hypothetical protein